MRVYAHAKINCALNVVGKRSDGYHELDMLMQSVSLYDVLNLSEAPRFSARCGTRPLGADDLIVRAANAYFQSTGLNSDVSINVQKNIPAMAGLGGGSADAAGVLLGLERMFAPLGARERNAIALSLGADVPFCLMGGLARARGIGEKLRPLSPPVYALLLLKPSGGVSTAEVFRTLTLPCPRADVDAAEAALPGGVHSLAPHLANALEPRATELLPEIAVIKSWLLSHGALGASMTGSGSCVYGLFASLDAAAEVQKQAPRQWWSAAVQTCAQGVEIVEE